MPAIDDGWPGQGAASALVAKAERAAKRAADAERLTGKRLVLSRWRAVWHVEQGSYAEVLARMKDTAELRTGDEVSVEVIEVHVLARATVRTTTQVEVTEEDPFEEVPQPHAPITPDSLA